MKAGETEPLAACNGLRKLTPSLPAYRYFDPAHFETELTCLWQRSWSYVGRSSAWQGPRSFRRVDVAGQRLFVVRDDAGTLRAFHDTCRHRGAALCSTPSGHFTTARIVCPYHGWSYSLDGALVRTSSKTLPGGFDESRLGLYPASLREWNGFVFVNPSAGNVPFEFGFDSPLSRLNAWPMESLKAARSVTKVVNCNWKIFWENYNECLHCPTVHRKLSRLVPIYGRGLLEERDDPDWRKHRASGDPKYDDPAYRGGVRADAATWSVDGRTTAGEFANLADEDRRAGYVYVTVLPTLFVVAHVDYVRTVCLRPVGPEQTELTIDFLVSPGSLEDPRFDLKNIVDFTMEVLLEDAAIAEVNQRGLRSIAHQHGVLMPEEWAVRDFHVWLDAALRASSDHGGFDV